MRGIGLYIFAYLAVILTWRNILRFAGLTGLMYMVLKQAHPDPTLILALCAMMGLPSFINLDNKNKNGEGE